MNSCVFVIVNFTSQLADGHLAFIPSIFSRPGFRITRGRDVEQAYATTQPNSGFRSIFPDLKILHKLLRKAISFHGEIIL